MTTKWLSSVPIFQILCLSGIFTAFNSVLQESVLAKGRSKAVLYVEILKKVVLVGMILLTFKKGIIGLATGFAISSLVAMLLSLLLSGKIVGYSIWHYMKDCAPYFTISSILCLAAYYLTSSIDSDLLKLSSCILFVGTFYFFTSWLLKLEPMMEMVSWVHKMINTLKSKNIN